jgi:group I intron endonuclease
MSGIDYNSEKMSKIGIIYKITNDVDDQIYVGSTFGSLNRRWCYHKSRCKEGETTTRKIYKLMRTHGVEKFHISLLESAECNTLEDLRLCEQKHMDLLNPTLNSARAHITPELKSKNAVERAKTWAEENKERSDSLKHKSYLKNKEKYLEDSKKRYEENKEDVKKRVKEYRAKNIEKINKKLKEKILCECGQYYQRTSKSRHIKSKAHKLYLNPPEVPETHYRCICHSVVTKFSL